MLALRRSPLLASCLLSAVLLQRESVTALRTKREYPQLFNYTPPLLHPHACKGASQEECDAAYREQTKSHLAQQKWTQQQNRPEDRDLQSSPNYNPRFGKINVLVLLIQFTDQEGRNLISKSDIESIWNGQIKDWFTVNAQGNYEVNPVVIDWTMTDNTEAFYADGQSGFTADLKKAMYPTLDKLDQEGFDFAPFDGDQDGRLDSVVFLHSGISAVAGAEDCFGNLAIDRIWPHAFTGSSKSDTWTSADGSVRLSGYTVNSVYDTGCDDIMMTAGLTCHEYMHTMDMIDLYDGTDLSTARGVGQWDVMGHPYGADNSGTPGLLGAWMKKELGWIDPIKIENDGVYTCRPAHNHLEAFMIDLFVPTSFDPEYLLIENRQPIGFESTIGGAGLLIWHIDDGAPDMELKGFPGQPGWPQNGNHYRIAVLGKDGNYDLETNENKGDPTDLFVPGDILGPGGGSVYPNTDAYQMGIITETGITLEVLTQEENGDITFRVSGVGPALAEPATPVPAPAPETAPETAPAPATEPASPPDMEVTSSEVGPSPTEPATEPAPQTEPPLPAATPQPEPTEPATAPAPATAEPVPAQPAEPVASPGGPATPQEPVSPPAPAPLPRPKETKPPGQEGLSDMANLGILREATQTFEADPNLQSGSTTRSFPTMAWSIVSSMMVLALTLH